MLNTLTNTKKEKYEGQAGALYPRPCLVLHLRPANFHARAKTITNTKKKTKANTNTTSINTNTKAEQSRACTPSQTCCC